MFNLKNLLGKLGLWVKSLVQKHDDQILTMVQALGPLVAATALRIDLTGEEKKNLIVAKVKEDATRNGKEIALSVVNEAIEIAANKYKLQIGTLTAEQLDETFKAVLNASK